MPTWQATIGLEVHAQLQTRAKIFCDDPVSFGEKPNTCISPISLGYPGTLPTLNRACVEAAIRLGLALESHISTGFYFSRKNYFYPDLPKGYQVTQMDTPICVGGALEVRLLDGTYKQFPIERVQLEEDTGKSLHDQDPFYTLLDYNRAGIGLVEIVSAPSMHTPEEAMAYLAEMRRLVRYLGICDGNMEEGSLRCDANVSVAPVGAPLGTRVEIKNLNSISALGKAIAYEIERQITLLEKGQPVERETRTWDGKETLVLREKETADDYRYFPEPDLQPVRITQEMLTALRQDLPTLPLTLFRKYTEVIGLPSEDALLVVEDKPYSDYYESLLHQGIAPKTAANWLNVHVRAWLNTYALPMEKFPIPAPKLAQLIQLVESRKVALGSAKEVLLPALAENPDSQVEELARKLDIWIEVPTEALHTWIEAVLNDNPDKVAAFQKGKKGLLGYFVGQVMQKAAGKADPQKVHQLLQEKLSGTSI
ncbi:MAG: Asp-tRNA(Asn)/Glu-tRNA(Gln) amidotransferase subunit GatB [Bacteroidia bacterium]